MKIANIVCTYPPYKGGIGNSAKKTAEFLKQAGHKVVTFTPGNRKDEKEKDVIRLKPFLKYGNGAFLPQLFFKLKKYKIIYLHYPFFGSAEVVWLFKKFNKRKKLIIHYHMDVLGLPWYIKFLSFPSEIIKKSLLKEADIIICSSYDYIENSDIKNFYLKNKEKFVEIPFSVDTLKFKPRANKEIKKTPKILFVGGLDKAHYFKGVDILIEAISKIKNKKFILQIVGNGNLLSYYKRKSKDLGILEKTEFLNNVSDKELTKLYREADLFVLPSVTKGEAFGIVLLEAMASGVPVIASNLPGVRKVFKNKEEGLIIKPNSVNDLVSKINKILFNKKLKLEMAEKTRKLAEKKYSEKIVKRKIIKIFESLR
jgi:glycosyltransferase involved in cell wall biosynthesis